MEKHTCKLCFRRFQNGRALGGHMRSHVISAGVDVNTGKAAMASTSSPEEPELTTPLSYVLRENPKKSIRISDPDQYISIEQEDVDESSSIVQDQDSDTDLPQVTLRRRRSKRRRRSSPSVLLDFELASSISTASLELEDVARSLMLLSRDVWIRSDPKTELPAGTVPELAKKAKNIFQCESCKKVFKSFQALGGHRASFKKGKGGCVGNVGIPSSSSMAVHQCPYCPRSFNSGQALGGHKRSHLHASSSPVNGGMNSMPSISSSPIGLIDLNLPAQAEDEFESSSVYDGEFDTNKLF